MDEEIRQKYIHLRNNMYNIKNNISKSISLYNDLLSKLKESLLINDEIYQKQKLDENLERLKSASSSVDSTIHTINSNI